jgi:hypothetical protein
MGRRTGRLRRLPPGSLALLGESPTSRSSPSPSSTESGPSWSATLLESQTGTRGACRTGGYASGAARIWSRLCATRRSKRGSWCEWLTSVAAPLPAQAAASGSPSPRAAAFTVHSAGSKGTGIWWVPTISPSRLAADPRTLAFRCSASTVGPVSCRHGVTDAATCTISGGVDPAWPRATRRTILCPVGVARRASPTWRLARIK